MVFKQQTYYGKQPEIAETETGPAAIAEARVAEALARAADVDATNVSVTAVGNQIVLEGTVAFPEEIAIAGDIASRVIGSGTVDNRLTAVSNDNTRQA